MNVAETLKASRKRLRLSQEQLADISGISRNTICAYEADRRTPSVETMDILLNAMGLELRVGRRRK